MAHGLDPERQPVIRWQWRPAPPPPLDAPLQGITVEESEPMPELFARPQEWEAFRAGFAQLASVTPSLKLYRLVQIFNTPLKSVGAKEAARNRYGYWGGEKPEGAEPGRFCHFWFFDDLGTRGFWSVELTFDDRLVLRATSVDADAVKSRHQELLGLVIDPPMRV